MLIVSEVLLPAGIVVWPFQCDVRTVFITCTSSPGRPVAQSRFEIAEHLMPLGSRRGRLQLGERVPVVIVQCRQYVDQRSVQIPARRHGPMIKGVPVFEPLNPLPQLTPRCGSIGGRNGPPVSWRADLAQHLISRPAHADRCAREVQVGLAVLHVQTLAVIRTPSLRAVAAAVLLRVVEPHNPVARSRRIGRLARPFKSGRRNLSHPRVSDPRARAAGHAHNVSLSATGNQRTNAPCRA